MEKMLKTEKEEKTKLVIQSLKNATSYKDYRTLVEENVANGTSTGPEQSPYKLHLAESYKDETPG